MNRTKLGTILTAGTLLACCVVANASASGVRTAEMPAPKAPEAVVDALRPAGRQLQRHQPASRG